MSSNWLDGVTIPRPKPRFLRLIPSCSKPSSKTCATRPGCSGKARCSPALVGVVTGVAAAFALARLISTFLFGVTARDPFVFVGVPALLTVVAVLAVWIPARRASLVDPLTALRYE
jgi:hypothetical protein